MELYISGRAFGKTTLLIRQSAKTKATIVTATAFEAKHIGRMAKHMNLDIPTPVSFQVMMNQRRRDPDKKYLIDNLELVLQGLGVETATIDQEPIRFLHHWGVPDGRTMNVCLVDEADKLGKECNECATRRDS